LSARIILSERLAGKPIFYITGIFFLLGCRLFQKVYSTPGKVM
jgi:hypothetical protein